MQDNSRGGGGSNENRRSIAEFLGLDTRLPDSSATGPPRNNVSYDSFAYLVLKILGKYVGSSKKNPYAVSMSVVSFIPL